MKSALLDRPAAAKAANTTAAPTQFQEQVKAIAQEADRLAQDLAAQQKRLDDLSVITEKQGAVRQQLEADELDYPEASAKLAELGDHHNALKWATDRKGEAAYSSINALRNSMTTLKAAILAGLNRAAGAVVASRQNEVRKMLASWGGTDAPDTLLPILTIAENCGKIRGIEAHRSNLEGWHLSNGPAAFMAIAGAAADTLAGLEVPEEQELLWGGPAVTSGVPLMAWDGISPGLTLLALCKESAEADGIYDRLRSASGFAGARMVFRFEQARAENQLNLPTEGSSAVDSRDLSGWYERFPAGSGIDPVFINQASAWLTL